MDARMTKAEAALLLPFPTRPDADRLAGHRRVAGHARDRAWVDGMLAPIRAVRAAMERRRVLGELATLSDRELADIGLTRNTVTRALGRPTR